MSPFTDNLRVFSGSHTSDLTQKICDHMGIAVGLANFEPFPDGETFVKLEDDVRGRDCFIVQSTCTPVNDSLMELLIFIDCLRRASAMRITAVIPYFGYARQDRKSEGRTPISAKLVANMINTAGANRVLAVDLHADQIQGFFDIPVDHLYALPALVEHYQELDEKNLTLVSPDLGNVKVADMYANHLHGELAVIDKRRISGDVAVAQRIIGDVKGKDVLMVDDMISTAGTICSAIALVKENGAKSVRIGATHGIFSGSAIERLSKAGIDEIVVTDTIALNGNTKSLKNLKIVSVAPLLGEAIMRIHQNESVSAIFKRAIGK